MTLRLFNTLTREVEPFAPLAPPRVTLYTCGPTVWNYAHIGNFRTFVFEDVLRRHLEFCGYQVAHVMNLTDVDDRTINAANAARVGLAVHTAPYIQAFFEDRDYLRLEPAAHYPRATEHIPHMVALIERLLERRVAYRGDDGSVYFAIDKFSSYGRLSRVDARALRAGARVSSDEYAKEDARDFVLWKAAKPEDERAGAAWDAPFVLFLSPSHREALASILYGVEQRKGFITITGEVGLGKTSILRYYLEQAVKKELETIYIFNPDLSFSGLMKYILREQGFTPGTEEPAELVDQFHHILIDRFKQGRNVVLIIDEAQNMPIETLESLRMLSNLETSKEKLLQIVLVGQPELEDKFQLRELRQLRQRVAIRSTIAPLSTKECFQYIKHRLAAASHDGPEMFTKSALKMIIAESRGVPRIINILCDNALITGFGYQKKRITTGIVREVINDLEGKSSSILLKRVLGATALLMIAGILSFFLHDDIVVLRKAAANLKFARQENPVSHNNENTGSPRTARVAAPLVQDKPVLKTERIPIKKKPFPVIRRVRKGDSLRKLVKNIYGYYDEELIALVMEHNPRITNSEKIVIGTKVIFPVNNASPEDK